MKTRASVAPIRRTFAGCLAGLLLCHFTLRANAAVLPAGAMKEYQPADDEFSAMSKSVVELLQSRDAARFAKQLTASVEDR